MCVCESYALTVEKKKKQSMQVKKKKLHVHKMFGNSSGFLWSLNYRVTLKGTPHEKVQAQKHNTSLLILNPVA